MDELMISGKRYISTRRAGKEYRYHADYIGQLIRAGKITGQKVGRAWYVSEPSLVAHLRKEAAEREGSKGSGRPPKGLRAPQIAPEEEEPIMAVEEIRRSVRVAEEKNMNTPPSSTATPEKETAQALDKLKMLRYIPDHIESSEPDNAAEMPEERPLVRARSTAPLEALQSQKQEAVIERSTDTEDEVPVPLRVTARPPQQGYVSKGAVSMQNQGAQLESHYSEGWEEAHYRSELPRKRNAALYVLMLLLVSGAALAAGFYFSFLPLSI